MENLSFLDWPSPSTQYHKSLVRLIAEIDILVYERDSLDVRREKHIGQDDEYFKKLSTSWSEALRQAFAKIEEFKV